MKYMLLICGVEGAEPDPGLDIVTATKEWMEETDRRGVRLLGHRLQPVADATTVRTRDNEVLVSDGPFAETKEQIFGFDIVECADLDEAIEVAAKHPVATFGTIEVRPFWPTES
jgi:hypothetical protein